MSILHMTNGPAIPAPEKYQRLRLCISIPHRTSRVSGRNSSQLCNEPWQQELWVGFLEQSIAASVKARLGGGRQVGSDGTIIQADTAIDSFAPIASPLSLQAHLQAQYGWVKVVSPEEEPAPETRNDGDRCLGASANFRGEKGMEREPLLAG